MSAWERRLWSVVTEERLRAVRDAAAAAMWPSQHVIRALQGHDTPDDPGDGHKIPTGL